MATRLCDYATVVGSDPIRIPRTPAGVSFSLTQGFDTGGRYGASTAFLVLCARLLLGKAQVAVNGELIGTIPRTEGLEFETQIMFFDPHHLSEERGPNNILSFTRVSDDFELCNITCFFHQFG
ncbi:hypothetical protein [Actinomycetospora aeridis]|uniref:Uncharacterized protein n=1 Tax=Actinomycetospora aeridis TaxID=3129231 RepID=A0ABU8NBZ3_9PSEU